jgi:hypothetical protein
MFHSVALVVALIRATRRNIPQDAIPHSHRQVNLKSYILHFSKYGLNVSFIEIFTKKE